MALDQDQARVTQALISYAKGDEQAKNIVFDMLYKELHRLASRYMRGEKSGHTLQATALVNEAYLKLINQESVQWQNRSHFLGIAAQAMRRILVDHARSRYAGKRGGRAERMTFDEMNHVGADPLAKSDDMVHIDEALKRLELLDTRQAKIVELRYFAGLSIPETAAVMEVSETTIKREWTVAKAWLNRELTKEMAHDA